MVFTGRTHEEWTYDVPGNVATYRTAARQVLTGSYDLRGRALLRDRNDATPDVTATYDSAGRVLTMDSLGGGQECSPELQLAVRSRRAACGRFWTMARAEALDYFAMRAVWARQQAVRFENQRGNGALRTVLS